MDTRIISDFGHCNNWQLADKINKTFILTLLSIQMGGPKGIHPHIYLTGFLYEGRAPWSRLSCSKRRLQPGPSSGARQAPCAQPERLHIAAQCVRGRHTPCRCPTSSARQACGYTFASWPGLGLGATVRVADLKYSGPTCSGSPARRTRPADRGHPPFRVARCQERAITVQPRHAAGPSGILTPCHNSIYHAYRRTHVF